MEMEPMKSGNPTRGKSVFTTLGCGSCHALAAAGTNGTLGPNLDRSLKGKDAAFIEQSILEPNAKLGPSQAVAQSDAQAAVRFLRAHASEFGIDPGRIAAAGWSAGSITAFAVGYMYEFLGDNTDNPGPSHRVSVVVGLDSFTVTPADMLPNDPPFELFRAALRPYDETLVTRIADDVDAGRLRAVDADGVVSLMLGAYLGELVRRGRVSPDWLDRSLEMIWVVMAPVGD